MPLDMSYLNLDWILSGFDQLNDHIRERSFGKMNQ